MRILVLIFLIFIIGAWIISYPKTPKIVNIPQATPNVSAIPQGTVVYLGDKAYRIYQQKIADPDLLTLIPNFSEKKTAQQIMNEYECTYGVNAGFYTPDDTPLGLFYVNGKYINKVPHRNPMFNGYVHKTNSGLFLITDEAPHYTANALDFAFQSGPFFRPEKKLLLTSDEPARRILIGQVDANNFFFVAITEEGNNYSGPYLSDVPEIINRYNISLRAQRSSGQLLYLLNLDGGSASAFFGKDGTVLSELVTIGSFLCAKQ